MEPDWGIVESILSRGMESLKNHISPPTWEKLEDDIDRFKYGEVYDLLAYINKVKKVNLPFIDEAGGMMGFLPWRDPADPTAPAVQYARKLQLPCKTEFPLDWPISRIRQEVQSIRHDSSLAHKMLWNDYKIKDGVRDGVIIRVIYESSGTRTDYWCSYPTNLPLTEQNNRLGVFRIWVEELLMECLDMVKGALPAFDYEICSELIHHGQYGATLEQLFDAFEKSGLQPSVELESARQAIVSCVLPIYLS
jgi:hypothetical protein